MSNFEIIRLLADGRFYSGEELGRTLGISRSAVWKQVQGLAACGVDIFSVRGKGYRLAQPIELLDSACMLAAMPAGSRRMLHKLETHLSLPSTNQYLMDYRSQVRMPVACLAEHQSQGRGRRGRRWVSPFGGNLYLSLLWPLGEDIAAVGGISLVVAVALMETLQELGVSDVGIKWPNDILWRGCKLAGILLELAGESSGGMRCIIGIGMNIRMPDNATGGIDQEWADLETVLARPVNRNQLAAVLLHHLLAALDRFKQQGLSDVLPQWRSHDICAGQRVIIQAGSQAIEGRAQGVDESGALLLLADDGQVRRFHSGEVSLRTANRRPADV